MEELLHYPARSLLTTWSSSRRRRCQRLLPNNAACALCQKHNVPCIPSSEATRASGSNGGSNAPVRPSSSTSAFNGTPASGNGPQRTLPGNVSPTFVPRSPVTDNGALNRTSLPPTAVSFHLAGLYFDYIHDQLHTLFQKPAFMADMATGQVPPVLLFAIIALSARSV